MPVVHRVVAAAGLCAYALAFPVLFGFIGPAVGAIQIPIVLYAAWRGGARWGVGVGLAAGLLTSPLYIAAMPELAVVEHIAGGGLTSLLFCALGFGVGRMRELAVRLRREKARYRSVVESVHDVVGQTDARGDWTYLNPAWEALTGFRVAETLGRSYFDFIHPDDRARSIAAFEALYRGEMPTLQLTCRCCRADGGSRHIEVRARALREHEAVVGVAGIITDVTDGVHVRAEREAREKVEQTLRLKEAILNNMSHEIRTPLTGIIGFSEVLAEEVGAEHEEFAQVIAKSGRRLLGTLNSVLDLARLESGNATLDLQPLDVAAEARDAVELLGSSAREKGLALDVQAGDGAPHARLDREALQRILANLVSNAVKYTEVGGVTVGIARDGGDVVLTVCDTGIGIADDFLPRIFDEFEQASSGVARSHEGVGLGLAITRRLVALMHGTIAVESAPGEGSRFEVRFPAAPAEAVAAVRAASSPLAGASA
jgi:PAS domain S-box-containing protein